MKKTSKARARLFVLLDRLQPSESVVLGGAPCDGKCVKEIAWPRDCVLATLRRGRQVIIPRGDTVLKADDVLAVVAEGEARSEVQRICEPSS